MIHSAEAKALAVQEASKLMSESLAGSITIGSMRIDDKGNIQYKDDGGKWTTVITPSEALTMSSTTHKYVDIEALKAYDKKIKEYIEERLGSLETEKSDSKYKLITGED